PQTLPAATAPPAAHPDPSRVGGRLPSPPSPSTRSPFARPLDGQAVPNLPPSPSTSDRAPVESDAATIGPSPLATDLRLKPAPLEPTDLRFPINLATALRLSDARPLIVAAAQASVWVAEAELTRAKVLWVPALNLGFDYIRH